MFTQGKNIRSIDYLRPMKINLLKSEIQLKLARKADNRLFLSFVEKKVVESV